jgi:hypothetical protein
VIETYIDESFDSRLPARGFAVGGWFGEGHAWRRLQHGWERLRKSVRPRIIEWKTKDCFQGDKEFKGWSFRKRLRLIERFVELATRHDIQGVVIVWSFVGPDPDPKTFDYASCLSLSMGTFLAMAAHYQPGERVAFTVDRRDKFVHVMQQEHERLKGANIPKRISCRVGPLEIGDSKAMVPLQVADLLAHAAYRTGVELNESGVATVGSRRRQLDKLVGKIAFQQYCRWDGVKRQVWMLRPTKAHPAGRWVRIRARP